VIGPSGAGKSTLARALLGLYAPVVGTVRLDGAEIDQWTRTDLGPYLGYLPQRVELLDGTIAENIARFGEVEGEKVVAAAQAAGVHELILRLPDGYDTMIQGDGNMLSAGQQQRIALARALYGDPRILVLDEPNANLDQEGDDALVAALAACRERGCTVVLVTHRANVLAQVDTVLMMADGRAALFGPRDEVIASMQARHGKVAVPAGPRPVNAPPALINQKFA
jgi:ATP-binding cassette subfamily C protein EexD